MSDAGLEASIPDTSNRGDATDEVVWSQPPDQTGFDCDCDVLPAWAGMESLRPAPTGEFVYDEALAAQVRSLSVEGMTRGGVFTWSTPIYVTDDPWPDILAPRASPEGDSLESVLYPQTGDGVWGEPIPWFDLVGQGSDYCTALVDIVGDAAWELVCISPFGWYEGQMQPDGSQRVLLDEEHWHLGFDRDAVESYPESIRAFVRDGELMGHGHTVRFRDYDADGRPEAILSTFFAEEWDYLLTMNDRGYFDAVPYRQGMTFGTCDFDFTGDLRPDAVYSFKELGENRAPNFNGIYWIEDEPSGFRLEQFSPLSEGAVDRTGWFGPSQGSSDHTPMGCARINWLPGYWLSQDDETSAVMYPMEDGTVCNVMPCLRGYSGLRASAFHWGVGFTSYRGRYHEGVVAVGNQVGGRGQSSLQYYAHMGSDGLRSYNRPGAEHRLGQFDRTPGNYYGLVAYDISGTTGQPDVLVTVDADERVDQVEPIRLFRNELDLVIGEQIIGLEILGRGGESAIVRFEFGGGEIEEVLVADGGGISTSPLPVVYQGVIGPTDITVFRPGQAPELYPGVAPGGSYSLRPRGDDGVLPPPVRLRSRH